MDERRSRIVLPIAFLLFSLAGLYMAFRQPDYLGDERFYGALIFLQFMIMVLWKYESRFLPFLLLVFLFAGTAMPLGGVWGKSRWAVLGFGAVAGLFLYLNRRGHHFGSFHLVAFFCVLSAFVSAIVSAHVLVACLKATSLLLLFLYSSTGARLALLGREEKCFSLLLLACEGLVYGCFVSYFALHLQFFGSPNSLGAMMGVVVVPFMLWGVLATAEVSVRRRRSFALVLALLLLLSSYARAGLAAAAIACVLLCLALRQFRLLLRGGVITILAALLVVTFIHREGEDTAGTTRGSLVSAFVYKGSQEGGILASRKPVWDRTQEAMREHPWFGTGFGTNPIGGAAGDDRQDVAYFSSNIGVSNEHGTSYLALMEWVGLLGVLPFAVLILMIARNTLTVFRWLWKTGDPHCAAVPIATIVVSGLIHAGFEDWLFAPGYYVTVIFWALAFVLVDTVPRPLSEKQARYVISSPAARQSQLSVVSGR